MRPSMTNYLTETKIACEKLDTYSKITIVVGNEAADLDSVVSAIVYAYFLSEKTKAADGKCLTIPLIWCHEDDIALRTEVIALFNKFSIDLNKILFQNQLPSLDGKQVEVILVDHNDAGVHKQLDDHVIEIIDHHENTNSFPNATQTIQTVGSCCTLIAQKIHYEDSNFLDLPLVSELLLSAILIDTFNLDLHSGRTTEQDVFIAEVLSTHTDIDSDALFSTLQKAKMDISTMSTYNILRKDYKAVQNAQQKPSHIGISSVTLPADTLLLRKDFTESVISYMDSLKLEVLVIMFLSFGSDSQAYRQLAVVSKNFNLKDELCEHLLKEEDLMLVEIAVEGLAEDVKRMTSIYKHNVKWSRKKVLPAISRFLGN